jgi:hypothetical protein
MLATLPVHNPSLDGWSVRVDALRASDNLPVCINRNSATLATVHFLQPAKILLPTRQESSLLTKGSSPILSVGRWNTGRAEGCVTHCLITCFLAPALDIRAQTGLNCERDMTMPAHVSIGFLEITGVDPQSADIPK